MALKSDAKFKAEPACLCKCDMRNLANFHARNGKSQNLHIDGVLMSNVYKVLIEKLQRSYVSSHWTLNRDTKFEEEPTCRCNNDMSNLACFHASTGKSQNLNFDGVLVFKVYKVLATKLLRSYVSSHWTVIQNLNFHARTEKPQNLHFDGIPMSNDYKVLWCKIWKKTYLLLQTWHEEFGEF